MSKKNRNQNVIHNNNEQNHHQALRGDNLYQDVLKAKDETIKVLKEQIEDLKAQLKAK